VLSDADVLALTQARHGDPFAVLGLHADATGKLWCRAMLPGATSVEVIDAATNKRAADLSLRDDAGLWEGAVPRRKNRFDYRLRVRWAHGDAGEYADAYAFGALVADDDLHFFGEGTHLRPYTFLGAHPMRVGEIDGVRFAVWAPNAMRVSVVGDFNAWDGRRHPMRSRGGGGVWEIFIPHAAVGDRYKFELLSRAGTLLPLKADPYARAAELRPGTASIVAALPPACALPPARAAANHRNAPISVYELHAASWRRHADGRLYSWDELAAALPAYVADLGFTHIELMPVSEHPFDGSWGYQTLGLFAPTARFGPPEGFEHFVADCHAAGLGVLVDWVPAHFPNDAHGLAAFDGSALYEYADPREGFHKDWNTLIYNFGRHEVKNFLVGSALYWIERFGVDGLRVDAVASMLYRDYSRNAGEWIPNVHGGRENLEAIALLKRTNEVIGAECLGAFTVAEESTAFPGVSAPTFAGGLGFHFKWNMGWMHDTLEYMKQDPVHRRWHHDKMSFGLVYAFSENFVLPLSHDEVVHGKGSLIGKMTGDEWQRFANLRLLFASMISQPAKKLLFMGGEFGQTREWNHDRSLDWHLLDYLPHSTLQRWVEDLNKAYRDIPALHELDFSPDGFEWIDCNDTETSVVSLIRKSRSDEIVLVALNHTPMPRHNYMLGVPRAGHWREILNSDATIYGGSGQGNMGGVDAAPIPLHGRKWSVTLTLPPLGAVFLLSEPA
jgi:1,4-alpha-glucan branching enzyme